jgi:alpha-galactosidase
MVTRKRIETVSTLAAVAMAFLLLPATAKLPNQLPDPDRKAPDTTKPVKVYILAGQSNMVGMGNISAGNSRHSTFFTSADGDVSGVQVSVYEGGYSPATDYDKLTAKATTTVSYGGTKPDPFPTISGEATHVVRGFIEVKTSGVYTFSPGYGDATRNIMVLDGREVYRKEPGGEAVQTPTPLTGGKRYPFKVTFLTKAANGLFWLGRTDIPGTLETVVKNDKKFAHLVDDKGNWTTRNDVYYYEARIAFKGSPLTVPPLPGNGTIGPELQFGHVMGYYHDEQVLVIKTAMGNRALAWDFRPPSSGKLPDIPEDLKKWEGLEYRLMVEGVRKTLDNIATIVPAYKGQGYEIAGFGWFQGHKDGGKQEWTDEYESNLVNLIKDVRAEFKVPKLPVVVATVAFGGKSMKGRYLQIHAAQMAVGDPNKHPEFAGNVRSVDTRDFWRSKEVSPNQRQDYHYYRNAETYVLVGDALGRGMVDLLKQKKK